MVQGAAFWWDRLADATGGRLDWSLRQQCLEAYHGTADRVEAWAEAHGVDLATLPDMFLPAT